MSSCAGWTPWLHRLAKAREWRMPYCPRPPHLRSQLDTCGRPRGRGTLTFTPTAHLPVWLPNRQNA
eukprot:3297803-Pyramimonas_sp.AAC.1